MQYTRPGYVTSPRVRVYMKSLIYISDFVVGYKQQIYVTLLIETARSIKPRHD